MAPRSTPTWRRGATRLARWPWPRLVSCPTTPASRPRRSDSPAGASVFDVFANTIISKPGSIRGATGPWPGLQRPVLPHSGPLVRRPRRRACGPSRSERSLRGHMERSSWSTAPSSGSSQGTYNVCSVRAGRATQMRFLGPSRAQRDRQDEGVQRQLRRRGRRRRALAAGPPRRHAGDLRPRRGNLRPHRRAGGEASGSASAGCTTARCAAAT